LNIVIAEDDRLSGRMLVRALEEAGHAVTVVEGAGEVSDACARAGTGLLLCDVNLGAGDGILASLAVRRERPGLAVVIMSADPQEVARAFRAGFRDVLLKPFTMDALSAAMDAARKGAFKDVDKMPTPPPASS
jgi:DNA-binding response OmpR family regulator